MEKDTISGKVLRHWQYIFLIEDTFHASAYQTGMEYQRMEPAATPRFCLAAVECTGTDKKTVSGTDNMGSGTHNNQGFSLGYDDDFQFFVPVPGDTALFQIIQIAGGGECGSPMFLLFLIALIHAKAAAVRKHSNSSFHI
jgi:hypothetical protein